MATEQYRVTASSLNVREAPSLTAGVKGHLDLGEVVDLIEKSDDLYWYQVKKNGLEGWASHKFLQLIVDGGEEEFPWMPIALAEEGVKEFPGAADNPRIVEYLRSTTLGEPLASNDETDWCSSFINWCVEKAGFEGTDSPAARSWTNWGVELDAPRRGCIAVFTRPPVAWQGHVGFYVGETATHVKVFSGNQSRAVKTSNYSKARLLGYRLPG